MIFLIRERKTLDGKTVYVYGTDATDFSGKYYIWADTGIIIKMETSLGGNETSYYFKDLTIGEVTEDDFSYPAGAEILDMGSFSMG